MSIVKRDSIMQSGILLSVMIVFFKALGFIKQFLIARYFGANVQTDCYYLAEGMVGPFSMLFFSAISVTFLTQYLKEKENGTKEKIDIFVSNVYYVTVAIAVVMSFFMYVFSDGIATILGSNFSDTDCDAISGYIKKLLIVLIIYSFISVANTILDAEKKFVYPKMLSFFLSIMSISFILFGRNLWGLKAVLYGFVFGYLIHAFLVVYKSKSFFSLKIQKPFKDERIQVLLKSALPLMAGNAIVELNELIDRIIATSAGGGTSTLLNYSAVISVHIISAVIVSVFGTIYFSHVSSRIIKNDVVNTYINKFVMTLVCGLLLITVIYIYSLDYIIDFIYGGGKLSSYDINQIKLISVAYAIGFVPFALREIYTKTCYAYDNTKKPMYNGIVGAIINVILSAILVRYFDGAGIAIATTVSYVIVSVMAYFSIKKEAGLSFLKDNKSHICKLFIAIIVMIVFICIYNKLFENTFFTCLIGCCTATILYIVVLYMLGYPEIKNILKKGDKC